LDFVQRLYDKTKLKSANDLVAQENGTVWVTQPPDGLIAVAREGVGKKNVASNLMRFRCADPASGPGCAGSWNQAVELGAFVNGIARDPSGSALFIASTLNGSIDRLNLSGDEICGEPRPLTTKVSGPDNLTWLDDDHLLVAGISDMRRWLQHAADPSAASPWTVSKVNKETGEATPILRDDGEILNDASVAVAHGHEFFIGQVFAPFVLRCDLSPAPKTEPEATASTGGGR
jgi:sugar lactone lactonase YvrE